MAATTTALVCFAAGVIGGVLSSAPIGPINLWVADATLRGRARTLAGFLAGVVLCDLGYAALAAWGYHALAEDARIAGLLSLLAGCVLIALGIVMIAGAGAARRPTPSAAGPFQPARQFALGTVMMGSNPAFLMFWVFAVDLVARHTGGAMGPGLLALFLAGVVIGDAAWFTILTRVVRSGADLLGSLALRRFERMGPQLRGGWRLRHRAGINFHPLASHGWTVLTVARA